MNSSKQSVKKNERPPMPESTLPSLRKLMEDCWAPVPSARPTFGDVNERLDEVLIDAAISDEKGREFWKANFLKNRFVSWDEFVKAFYKFLGVSLPHDDAADDKKKEEIRSTFCCSQCECWT